jgi:AcrR family transcriptional regulator
MARKIIPEKVEEAKDRIIHAALDVIIEDGLAQCTLTKVAAKAGITKAAIYWYFAGKDEMLYHMAASFRKTFIESAKLLASQPIPLAQKLEALILSLEEDEAHKKCFLPVKVFIELYSAEHEIKETIREIYTEYIGIIEGIFTEAIRKNELKISLPAASLARMLMVVLDGCTIQDEIMDRPHIDYQEVYRLFAVFVRNLG